MIVLTALDVLPKDRVRRAGSKAPFETVVIHNFSFAPNHKGTVFMTFTRQDGDTPFVVRSWGEFAQEMKFEIETPWVIRPGTK